MPARDRATERRGAVLLVAALCVQRDLLVIAPVRQESRLRPSSPWPLVVFMKSFGTDDEVEAFIGKVKA